MILAAVALASSIHLVDQSGRHFTLASLRGEPVVVTFVAAHCTDACPLIDAQVARASREAARERLRIRFLTITLDPEHDPPSVMRALAKTFDADEHHWLVATGSVPAVHRIMRAFGVVAQRGRRGYADVHTTFVYLLDRDGAIRKILLASAGSGQYLMTEIRQDWSILQQ